MIRYAYPGNGTARADLPLMTIRALFYCHAKHAVATLESMLAQDYGNVEVVVSDDCSPDGTGEKLLEAARRYRGPHKVVVNINEANMGIGDHYAYVISLSHGEIQTSLGGDDIAEPWYLSTIRGYADKYPKAVAIGCGATQIDEDSGEPVGEAYVVPAPRVYPRYESGPMTWSLNPGDDVTVVPVTGVVSSYRKELLDAHSFPKGIIAEDAFLGFRAPLVGDVLFIPEKCVRQRLNMSSMMRKGHYGARSARNARRRRHSAMTFLSADAALREVPVLRPGLDACFSEVLANLAAEGLIGSFVLPDPFGVNWPKYRAAFSVVRRHKSVVRILKEAWARGIFVLALRLILRRLSNRN